MASPYERRSRSPIGLLAIAVAVLVVVGLFIWALLDRSASEKVKAAALAVRDSIMPSDAKPAESSSAAALPEAVPEVRPEGRPRAAEPRRSATSPGPPASSAAPVASVPGPTDGGARGLPAEPALLPRPAPTGPIYDAGSAGIVAPRLIAPQANVPLRPRASGDPLMPAIEIVVDEDGRVASVKSTIRPTTLAEAIRVINGLSMAQTWRFRPAMQNSHPVKYRLVIPLSAF